MSEWQKKLADICDDLGIVGEIYFRDISDAVLAEIDAAREQGVRSCEETHWQP